MMRFFRIRNRSSGADLGVHPGETPEEALTSMARASVHADYASAAAAQGLSVDDPYRDLVIEETENVELPRGEG